MRTGILGQQMLAPLCALEAQWATDADPK